MADNKGKSDSTAPARPPLPPPRFGLKTIFSLVTVLAVILASYHYWGGLGVAGACLAFSVIGAHFLGSSLGHRLQTSGSKNPGPPEVTTSRHTQVSYAKVTSLSGRRDRDFSIIRWALGIGAFFAACGGFLFAAIYGEQISWVAISVGATAFFVVGTLAGFVVISFVSEAIHAMNDATKEE